MIPAAFDYDVAESVDHAVELLGKGGGDAKLLAGGHSLIPAMKLRIARPSLLVDIGRLSDLAYVEDVGTVVNPLIVGGQVHGGITQGISAALYEEGAYDEAGNLQTANLLTYLVPSSAELPSFELERTESTSPTNPLGVKGVGETGTIAAAPAVINAVLDALSHLGVKDIQMPATPERVWRAIQEAKA